MFKDFGGGKLPALTQFVIGISHGVVDVPALHPGGRSAVIASAMRIVLRTEKGRLTFDGILLQPAGASGRCMRKIAVARFTRTLGTLLSSGVPILDALDIVAQDRRQRGHRGAASSTRAPSIREGKNMAEPLMETGSSRPWSCR